MQVAQTKVINGRVWSLDCFSTILNRKTHLFRHEWVKTPDGKKRLTYISPKGQRGKVN
jgi:hypothetical protein